MTHPKEKPYIVILAGGGGTRLWPKSRQSIPKQFLKLFSHRTLLQETYSRVAPLTDNDRIFVVAPSKYQQEILTELPDLTEDNLIIEPQAKNTAPAFGLASTVISKRNPDAVLTFIASDAYLVEIDEFQRVLLSSAIIAERRDDIVVWGLHPTSPDTTLGYIHSGDEVDEVNQFPIFRVLGFREKPNASTAQAYIATGKYFWNLFNVAVKARVLLDAIGEYAPDLKRGLDVIAAAWGTERYRVVAEEMFSAFENEPIELAVWQKANNLVMIPASYSWSDIGNWDRLYDISDKDADQNSVLCESGEYLSYDSHGNLIHTHGRAVATIGVKDMVIIDTPDVVMICPMQRCPDVKKLVELLKSRGKKEYL